MENTVNTNSAVINVISKEENTMKKNVISKNSAVVIVKKEEIFMNSIENLADICLAVGTAGFVGVDCPEEEAEIHEIYESLIKKGYGVEALDELIRTAYDCGEDSYISNNNDLYIKQAIYAVEESYSPDNKMSDFEFDMQLFAEKKNPGTANTEVQNNTNSESNTNENEKGDVTMTSITKISENVKALLKKRASIQKKHEFAKQKIRNFMDTTMIAYQGFKLTDKWAGRPVFCGTLEKAESGMNPITRDIIENGTTDAVIFNGGTAGTYRGGQKPYTTNQMFHVDISSIEHAENAMEFTEAIAENFLRVQYIGSTDVILWIKEPVGKAKKSFQYRAIRALGTQNFGGIFNDIDQIFCEENSNQVKTIINWPGSIMKTYGLPYPGTNGCREGKYDLYEVYTGETREGFAERMLNMFDAATGGLITSIQDKIALNGEVSREEIFKLVSRISLAMTPMTPTVHMKSFAFYNGSFGLTGQSDGEAIINGDPLADFFGVDPEDIYGLVLQMRVIEMMIAKGLFIPVSGNDINTIVNFCFKKKECVSFETFRNLCLTGKFEEETLYIVNSEDGKVDAIFDKNSMKAVGISSDGYTLQLVAVRDKTKCHMNIQDAECMAHLNGAPEFLFKLGMEHINRKLQKLDDIYTGKLSKNVVNPDGFIADLVADIAPGYVKYDAYLWKTIVTNTFKSIVNDINGFKFEFNNGSYYRYFLNDFMETITGIRVLDDNEYYIPGSKSKESIVTRSPKTYGKEYYHGINLDLLTSLIRCEERGNGKVNAEVIKVVQRMFVYVDDAAIIKPADKGFADSTGGSDTDGDGGASKEAIDNPNDIGREYIDIQLQEKHGISSIPKPKASGIMIKSFDFDMLQEMQIAGLFGQKDEKGNRIMPTPIGKLDRQVMVVRDLANCKDDNFLSMILEDVVIPALKNMRKYQQHEGFPYERMFTEDDTNITDLDVVVSTENFYNSDWGLEGFKNYLQDANRFGPSICGRTLHMVTNGDTVHAGYAGVLFKKQLNGWSIWKSKELTEVRSRDSVDYVPRFSYENDNIVVNAMQRLEDNVMYSYSPITSVRQKLIDYAVSAINEFFARDIEECETIKKMTNNAFQYVDKNDLSVAKTICSMVTGTAHLNSDDRKNVAAVLANTTRGMFDIRGMKYNMDDSMSDAEKNAVVSRNIFAATKKSSDGSNTFKYIAKDDFIRSLVYIGEQEGFETNNLVGYKAYASCTYNNINGEELVDNTMNFYDGESLDGTIITDKKVNGSWMVSNIDGHLYVTRTIEEHFVPEKSNRIVILMTSYIPEKKKDWYNRIPAKEHLVGADIVASINEIEAYITTGNEKYSIKVASYKDNRGKYRSSATRFSKILNKIHMRGEEMYQYEDGKGQVNTILIVSRVEKKEVPQIQDYSNDVSNAFDTLSANTADFDVITK